MNLRHKIIGILLGGCISALAGTVATAAPPEDLVTLKPYVSTSKMGIAMKNEVVAARTAYSKVQTLRNVSYAPVAGWLYDPKSNMKSLKPDADAAGFKKVDLPFEWSNGSVAIFQTTFTLPDKVNNFSVGGKALTLSFEGRTNVDVFINGKKLKSFTGGGELDLSDKIKQGESVTLGVKVTDMTQRGQFVSVRVHAAWLDDLAQPADEVLNRLESAALLFDQMPRKQKELLDAVIAVSNAMDDLKGVKDADKAKAALAKMKSMLSPIDDLLSSYPLFNAGPYLMNVKQDEITVGWETRVPSPSTVFYGEKDLKGFAYSSDEVTFHKVVIKGLKPETVYRYQAMSNKLAAPESTFKTAINRDTPFKFAVWADDQSNPQVFEPLVDLMIPYKPDIGISIGDEVGRGDEYPAWAREFFRPLRRMIINTPFFVAIGNHEYGGYACGKPVEWFEKYIALPSEEGYYYAVTYGNARFIMINQQAETGCPGPVPGTKEYEWLLKELESPEYKDADFHFMFMHKPPYSDSWSGGYYDGEPGMRSNVVPLIEKYGVDIVFSGHTHEYERGQWPRPGGPYYIITGGAGGGLDDTVYKEWPQMQKHMFVHHFSLISIDGKKLKFTAIDDKGNQIDSFEIDKTKKEN